MKDVDYCLITHLHFDCFSPDQLPLDLRITAQNHEDEAKVRDPGFGRRGMYGNTDFTCHEGMRLQGAVDRVLLLGRTSQDFKSLEYAREKGKVPYNDSDHHGSVFL